MSAGDDSHTVCECAICASNLDFELDPHLVNEIEKYNCVIFAGAGISTEGKNAHADSFYEELRAEVVDCPSGLAFSELVDLFEKRPNGRQKLIQKIKERFNYIDAFRDLRLEATRFHRSLSGAPYFETIITTNWDRYFEEYLGGTPFVYDFDIPFWEDSRRPILKIHGSIDNFSSIVASGEDYRQCEARLREGALGAVLKQIFATKTCIFCGYSAEDSDFLAIYKTIREGLGKFSRTHYLVSPFLDEKKILDLKNDLNIVAVKTNAAYFIDVIRNHMEEKFCFAKRESYNNIAKLSEEIEEIHSKFIGSYDPKLESHLIFATGYQDGLIHSLNRIVDREFSGDHADLHKVRAQIEAYEDRSRDYIKKKDYWNAAYFLGYRNGLLYFDMVNVLGPDEAPLPPFFYHPGAGEIDEEFYLEEVRPKADFHKGALAQSVRMVRNFAPGAGLVIQHSPFG